MIGTFTLTESRVYRRGYETANWYTDIEVQPGDYEVTTDGYWAFVKLPGIVVESSFDDPLLHARVFHTYEDVGKDQTYTIQTPMSVVSKLEGYTPAHNKEVE
jgi:hypothetical protein